ncbi:MAG: hypothetical protein HC845_05910 [Akkermansiaceae bacterium]|nr:hypothetical protein [Akkermansiaceae bacterium]
MKFLTLACVIFGILPSVKAAPAPEYLQPRSWTGSNGAVFLGQFVRTLEDGKKVEFMDSTGKTIKTDFQNLSEKDQQIVLILTGKAPVVQKPDPKENADAFKILPIADRSKIPELDPLEFGTANNESMVNEIWVSLLWWDTAGVLPVPKSGDFKKKAEWLHEDLTRYIVRGGSYVASIDEAKEGVAKYFEKRLEDTAICKITSLGAQGPEGLSKWLVGNNIVIIKMSMKYLDDQSYVACGSLKTISNNGDFTMNLLGVHAEGKILPVSDQKEGKGKMYELIISNRHNLPKRQLEKKTRFYIGENGWEGVLVMSPSIYKTPREKSPAPK